MIVDTPRADGALLMNNTSPLLEVRDVAKRFGSVVALRSATLTISRGEIHALMGANGAGKSTLLKILTGVHPADSGTIIVDGEVRTVRSPAEARRAGIVSVYQDPALVPDLTVGQNMRLADVTAASMREHLDELGIARPQSRPDGAGHSVSHPAPHRSGPRAGVRSDRAHARRDHRRAASRPVGKGLRSRAALARPRQFGDLHFSSHRRGGRSVRPRHGPARRPHGGRRGDRPGQREPDRLADARRRDKTGFRRGRASARGERRRRGAGGARGPGALLRAYD